jgi:glycosyltransferase involved in cell wall biosynthesis
MKIGIDLRALQTGHKFRGIGEVAKQTTSRILRLAADDTKRDISFIFYEYDDDDPKSLLNIPDDLQYEVVKLGPIPESNPSATKLEKIQRNFNQLYGSPIKDSGMSDIFLQFDYAFGVPKDTKTVLIKHDLIPYVFWDKYFELAWVPFKNKAARTTLRTLFANHKFIQVLRRSLKNAHVILTVSGNTKKDIEKYFHVPTDKSKVVHLGVDVKPAITNDIDETEQLPTKPYLLFIGAGDARRRVDDAIAAFNNLKAEGHDIQFVLVGENFKAPEKIPTASVRKAVMESSYKGDILTLGYVSDAVKQKLYREAVAFVYPTKYEGFGIPVLEAMLLECPIITYRNSSIPEVGGGHAIYAKDWVDIKVKVEVLLAESKAQRHARVTAAKEHAQGFTWDKTSRAIYNELIATRKI